jgi:hypothetical protein
MQVYPLSDHDMPAFTQSAARWVEITRRLVAQGDAWLARRIRDGIGDAPHPDPITVQVAGTLAADALRRAGAEAPSASTPAALLATARLLLDDLSATWRAIAAAPPAAPKDRLADAEITRALDEVDYWLGQAAIAWGPMEDSDATSVPDAGIEPTFPPADDSGAGPGSGGV